MAGLPKALTSAPLRVVRPQDLADVYTQPNVQLARLARQGRVRRVAHGFYLSVPDNQPPTWLPTLEALAAGVATAIFGERVPVLMHLSAARLHGALPRAIGTALVAAPRQHAPTRLEGERAGAVVYVCRDIEVLDAVLHPTDLGAALVTGIEQTVLDLARRPALGDMPQEAEASAMDLLPRCDQALLEQLAVQQRAAGPVDRLRRKARAG